MSKIDKCDYVKSHLASRTIFRKRLLYLRDYNSITDSVVVGIAMFSKLKNLLELEVTVDAKGYVSVMFDLDACILLQLWFLCGTNMAYWCLMINHNGEV